jgi:hypothetical protein
MVHGASGQNEEKDYQGPDNHHSREETENVQFSRMERLENCVQKVKN